MKTFETFNNTDELEKFFLEVAHLNELEIRFDFINFETYMFYFYNYKCFFHKMKKTKIFYMDDYYIFSKFKSKFNINYRNFRLFTKKMIDKHLNLDDYIPDVSDNYFPI